MKDDSIEGIYDTLKQCALISKSAGGIGVAVSCIRATGSYIAGVSFLHPLLLDLLQWYFKSQQLGLLHVFCHLDKWQLKWPGSYASCLQ